MKCITTKEYDCLLYWSAFSENDCEQGCNHPYWIEHPEEAQNAAQADDIGDDDELCDTLIVRGLMYRYQCPYVQGSQHIFLNPRGRLAIQIYLVCQKEINP